MRIKLSRLRRMIIDEARRKPKPGRHDPRYRSLAREILELEIPDGDGSSVWMKEALHVLETKIEDLLCSRIRELEPGSEVVVNLTQFLAREMFVSRRFAAPRHHGGLQDHPYNVHLNEMRPWLNVKAIELILVSALDPDPDLDLVRQKPGHPYDGDYYYVTDPPRDHELEERVRELLVFADRVRLSHPSWYSHFFLYGPDVSKGQGAPVDSELLYAVDELKRRFRISGSDPVYSSALLLYLAGSCARDLSKKKGFDLSSSRINMELVPSEVRRAAEESLGR